MPVRIPRSPFNQPEVDLHLRVTQVRVLGALMPADVTDHPVDWPLFSRASLCKAAGISVVSGSLTRIMNGIRAGNQTSGAPHPGLVDRGMICCESLEVADGVTETNYRITALGIRAYQAHIAAHGELPPLRDKATATNKYQGKGENHRSKRAKPLTQGDDDGMPHDVSSSGSSDSIQEQVRR